MDVNGDFSQRVLLHSTEIPWESSPMQGVERRRLDRVGDNDARVTTIVRYAPGSHFSPHTHDTGEELLILEGVFEDDYGNWPAGSYVRNPPTSQHQPGSKEGCIILVKLGQFDLQDRTFVHIDTQKIDSVADRQQAGVRISPLYKDEQENVRIEYWEAGATITFVANGGAELLVLQGDVVEAGELLKTHSWLRLPDGYCADFTVGEHGVKLWVKTGHLAGL